MATKVSTRFGVVLCLLYICIWSRFPVKEAFAPLKKVVPMHSISHTHTPTHVRTHADTHTYTHVHTHTFTYTRTGAEQH